MLGYMISQAVVNPFLHLHCILLTFYNQKLWNTEVLCFNNFPLLFEYSGNTLNCNHPVVKDLILDSLRHWYPSNIYSFHLPVTNSYWICPETFNMHLFMCFYRVTEYHVDGFRFDLASVLCRDTDGTPLNAPPLIKVMEEIFCDRTWNIRSSQIITFTALTNTLVIAFWFANFYGSWRILYSDQDV